MEFNSPQYPEATLFVVSADDKKVAQSEKILNEAGYKNVTTFSHASTAWQHYHDVEPDLVIVDLAEADLQIFSDLKHLSGTMPQGGYQPVLVIASEDTKATKERALSSGAKDFLARPFDSTELSLHVRNLLETRFLHKQLRENNERLESMVQRRTSELWDAVKTLESADQELRLAQEETIRCLSLAGEYREVQTALHVDRMGRYCERLARMAGLDEEQVNLIRSASPMHDIGKIGVPDRILMKPGPLTPEERETMERHTEIGHRILSGSKSKLLSMAATIALTHHERFDGDGYPNKIAGYDIPIEGRIAAIGDVFDALLSQRPYRTGFPLTKVFKIMREGRGTQFDPELLDMFLEAANEFLAVSFQSVDEMQSFEKGAVPA